MEFIKNFKQKQQISRENRINEQALDYIRLADFDNKIFIAYNDTPMVLIEDSWTPREILSKLNETRERFISYQKSQFNSERAL